MKPLLKKWLGMAIVAIVAIAYLYWMYLLTFLSFWLFVPRMGKNFASQAAQNGNHLLPHFLLWTLVAFILIFATAYFLINKKSSLRTALLTTTLAMVAFMAIYVINWHKYETYNMNFRNLEEALSIDHATHSFKLAYRGDTLDLKESDTLQQFLNHTRKTGIHKFASTGNLLVNSGADSPGYFISIPTNGHIFGPHNGDYFYSETSIFETFFVKTDSTNNTQ